MKHYDRESCIQYTVEQICEAKKVSPGDWKKQMKIKAEPQAKAYCEALYPAEMRLPKRSDTTPEVLKLMKVPNKDWHDRQRRGLNNAWLKPEAFIGHGDLLPPGAWYFHQVQTKREMPLLFSLPSPSGKMTIELRENQVEVFEQIRNIRSALVDFKTGSGKTILAVALAQLWDTKTLVLVHSVDNVKYFKDTFKNFAGIDAGAWYGGEKRLAKVTITTHTTARQQRKMFAEYGFENLIIDEADIFFTEKAREVVCSLPCSRKIAFTGTIKTDADEYFRVGELKIPSLVRFYGKHIRGKADETKNPIRGVFYAERETYYEDEFGFPIIAKDWALFRKTMDEDSQRFEDQMDYLANNFTKDDHALVLFDRVADVERAKIFLNNYYEKTYMLHGSVKKQERIDNIDNFKKTGGIMVAQYKTAGRGLDLPACNKLFLLFPSRKETAIQQMVGRIIRWLPKKESFVYDWRDSCLESQWASRKKTYITKFNYEPKKIANY